MYYAHTTENPGKEDWQLLKDHLTQVADLSSRFATDFNGADFAYASGLLHDIGKYSEKFQRRLEGSSIRVDHSTAGARESGILYNKAQGIILAYLIAGHHNGLLNYGSEEKGLYERILHSVIDDYSAYKDEIIPFDLSSSKIPIKVRSNCIGFSLSFFIRMIYSCLVDADSLDTESFMNPDASIFRGKSDSLANLHPKLNNYLSNIIAKSDNSPINKRRVEILQQCEKKAECSPGFYSLTVPTGGGKTLSSMAFAQNHVKNHDMKRIFYVIPYTSIIEQNAAIFRDIFGEKNVLEHHSNFDPIHEDEEDEYFKSNEKWYQLVSENWDVPITVTTNVQFFESLFSNKRSRCRKLHNLSKSVIILDEAQMLPTEYLKPTLHALTELVVNYGSTVVFCTATQPKIGELLDKDQNIVEIISSPLALYEQFKRVRVLNLGKIVDDLLVERLEEYPQSLCIVNTRKHAQILFDLLADDDSTFHLSAKMCPVHRREKLTEIRKRLSEGKRCRVISTQLIEAGVDVDFPVVFRAMTGIDSIAQAAGRCNREGKRDIGDVFLFSSVEIHGKPTSWQRKNAEIGEMVLEHHDDPLSLPAIEEFFSRLYFYEGDEGLDQKKILPSLEERAKKMEFPFEDVGCAYRLIEENTKDVIIPYNKDAESAIESIRKIGFPGTYARKLQGFTVNIYYPEFRDLLDSGAIEIIGERFHILVNPGLYSLKTGLVNRSGNDDFSGLLIA